MAVKLSPNVSLAVIVAVLGLATAVVVTEKVPDVAPPATVTVAGTTANVESLFNLIVVPLEGAIPLRVTVPVELPGPGKEFGDSDRPVRTAGEIVNCVVIEVEPIAAVIFGFTGVDTARVATVSVVDVVPAEMVTVEGTDAAPLLEESETFVPPDGATELMVTVAVALVPPVNVDGSIERLVRLGGNTVSWVL